MMNKTFARVISNPTKYGFFLRNLINKPKRNARCDKIPDPSKPSHNSSTSTSSTDAKSTRKSILQMIIENPRTVTASAIIMLSIFYYVSPIEKNIAKGKKLPNPEMKIVSLDEKYRNYQTTIFMATKRQLSNANLFEKRKQIRTLINQLPIENVVKIEAAFKEYFESQVPKEKVTKDVLTSTQSSNITTVIQDDLALYDKILSYLNSKQVKYFFEVFSGIDAANVLTVLWMELDAWRAYDFPKVYVLSFSGDMNAKQVSNLRDEITAILVVAEPHKDKVVLNLMSPGGTVTSYGAAAAQLDRLKKKNINLVACVDEIAASGGYLMACVADKIVASPFAILGVVRTIPNFSERMKREGISVEELTAGAYKRTLTPYKQPTDSDRAKLQEDLNAVQEAFKKHVKTHRPQIDIDKVATGETWFGQDALDLKLCDNIATVDDVLMQLFKSKHTLYSVKKAPPPSVLSYFSFLQDFLDSSESSNTLSENINIFLWNKFCHWLQINIFQQDKNGLLGMENENNYHHSIDQNLMKNITESVSGRNYNNILMYENKYNNILISDATSMNIQTSNSNNDMIK